MTVYTDRYKSVQRQSLLVCNYWKHFLPATVVCYTKTIYKVSCHSPRGSCSCTTMSSSPGICNPEETGLPRVVITHTILQISLHRATTCSLNWKNKWKVAIFRPTRRSLPSQRPGWTDTLLFFFLSGFQKLEQRAKKRIELRGEFFWINPEFGRFSLFPFWSG